MYPAAVSGVRVCFHMQVGGGRVSLCAQHKAMHVLTLEWCHRCYKKKDLMKLLRNSYGSQCADSRDTLKMYVSILNSKQYVSMRWMCADPKRCRADRVRLGVSLENVAFVQHWMIYGEELKQFETEKQRLWLKASGHESEAAVAKTRIRRKEASNSSKKWQDYSPVFQVN